MDVKNTREVLENWNRIKKDVEGRKQDEEDFFENISKSAPELERCYSISKKAAKVGFDWPDIEGVYDKVSEEFNEVKQAKTEAETLDELGDLLFIVVNLCRFKHVKPTDALSYANNKFTKRFNILVNEMKARGLQFEEMTLDLWDELWNIAKAQVH